MKDSSGNSHDPSAILSGQYHIEAIPKDRSPLKASSKTEYKEPAIPNGHVRMYHGGEPGVSGKKWLSPDRNFSEKGYTGGTRVLQYVDIPKDSPHLRKAFDDEGTDQVSPYVNFEAPEEISRMVRPVPKRSPSKRMSSWTRYEGPRDGRGWKHESTGEIRYQDDQPVGGTSGPAKLHRLKKVFDFKTDEGTFATYDIDKEHRGRPDMFTVHKDKGGYIVRNSLVPDDQRRKGLASELYRALNAESLKKTGNPLRSTQPRTLATGEVVHELSDDAVALWDNFVRKGEAEKLGEKNYRFYGGKASESDYRVTNAGGRLVVEASDCGANSPGGGGFTAGNDCAKGGDSRTISELIADHNQRGLDNAQRRPEVESAGHSWKHYKRTRYAGPEHHAVIPPTPTQPSRVNRTRLIDSVAQLWNEVDAEYGGVDLSGIPSDTRDVASTWQAEWSDDKLPEIIKRARDLFLDGSVESAKDGIRLASADMHAASWDDEWDRIQTEERDREYKQWQKREENQSRIATQIESALPSVQFSQAAGGSWYADYKELKIRISDHPQVAGGGFNEGTGERMGESDIQIIVDHEGPETIDAKRLRRLIAGKLRDNRNDKHDDPKTLSETLIRSNPGIRMSSWTRYDGPRGGKGWKDNSTGEIRYQDESPQERYGRELTKSQAGDIAGPAKQEDSESHSADDHGDLKKTSFGDGALNHVLGSIVKGDVQMYIENELFIDKPHEIAWKTVMSGLSVKQLAVMAKNVRSVKSVESPLDLSNELYDRIGEPVPSNVHGVFVTPDRKFYRDRTKRLRQEYKEIVSNAKEAESLGYSDNAAKIHETARKKRDEIRKLSYNRARKRIGHLVLDGATSGNSLIQKRPLKQTGILAHEIGHVIDVGLSGKRISSTEGWQKAWMEEIADVGSGSPLSEYGAQDPVEGWAEFTRLVLTRPHLAVRDFPKCWEIWKMTR